MSDRVPQLWLRFRHHFHVTEFCARESLIRGLAGYLNCDCGPDPPLCEWALNGVSVVHHVCVYIYDVLHVPVLSWLSSSVDMRAFTEDSAENWMERSRDHRKEYGTFVVIEQNWLERISHFSFGLLLEVIHVFTVCANCCICISVYVSYAVGILYQTSHWVRIFHYDVEEGTERISLRS